MKKIILTAIIALSMLVSCSTPDAQVQEQPITQETSLIVGKWNSVETIQCGPEFKFTFFVNRSGSFYDNWYDWSNNSCESFSQTLTYDYSNHLLTIHQNGEVFGYEVVKLTNQELILSDSGHLIKFIRE